MAARVMRGNGCRAGTCSSSAFSAPGAAATTCFLPSAQAVVRIFKFALDGGGQWREMIGDLAN